MSIPSKFKLPEEGNLLVAFSGGSDSLCLLYLLSQVARNRTVALYVDHNLREREELEEEIKLNRKNAALLGIPLVVETIPPGEVLTLARNKGCGTEAAARNLRYSILERYANVHGCRYILTAHHREDQCETVLMRMLEGSPFWTWSGIQEENGRFLRPMLDFSKKEILSILFQSGMAYATDSTNTNTVYKRNFIRKNLMPLMDEKSRETLVRIAKNIRQHNQNMHSVHVEKGVYCTFDTEEFLSAMPRMQEKALFECFSALSIKGRVTRALIQEIVEKAKEKKGKMETHMVTVYFSPEKVRVYGRMEAFSSAFCGEATELPYGLAVDMKNGDESTLSIPNEYLVNAVIRTALPDDRILLRSGWRKVHDFQKEYRIPQSLVLEQNGVVVAVLDRVLGGRDRLFSLALGKSGSNFSLILHKNINY